MNYEMCSVRAAFAVHVVNLHIQSDYCAHINNKYLSLIFFVGNTMFVHNFSETTSSAFLFFVLKFITGCLFLLKTYGIRFCYRFCFSDEEPEYPSSELNSHGPAVVGWRCRPDSTLSPKEIILRFDKPAVICRIQVLAHQYMIRECQLFAEILKT